MIQTALILLLISSPAIYFQARSSIKFVKNLIPPEEYKEKQIFVAVIIQNLVLLTVSALFGSWFLENVAREVELSTQLIELGYLSSILTISIASIIVFLTMYYFIFRKLIGEENAIKTEKIRLQMGLLGRVFSGGVFEEILFRFGIQNFLIWILLIVLEVNSLAGFVIAVFTTSILFGLLHLPSIKLAEVKFDAKIITAAMILNVFIGLVLSYLTITFGILSAVFTHVTLHLVWHLIEVKISKGGKII